MSAQKFKVFCTFDNDWDLSEWNIEFRKRNITSRDELLGEIKGCHGIVVYSLITVDKNLLDAAGDQLKVISNASSGYDHIDLEECEKRGIVVGSFLDANTGPVAEFAVAMALMLSKKILNATKLSKEMDREYLYTSAILSGKSIQESTVGIFGLGRIENARLKNKGLSVAKKFAAGFDVKKVIYYNRTPIAETDKLGYEYVTFDELLKQSDIVVCCASLNSTNEGTFNMDAFRKMKKTSVFVNVARGAMVNHDDLAEALKSNMIGSAGLDVTHPEILPNDHPLHSLPNCVITPHIAYDDEFSRRNQPREAIANLVNGLMGKPLYHQIAAKKIGKQ